MYSGVPYWYREHMATTAGMSMCSANSRPTFSTQSQDVRLDRWINLIGLWLCGKQNLGTNVRFAYSLVRPRYYSVILR